MAANVADVTDTTFQAEVIESSEPVLVDFWAPWCGPCRMVSPVLEQISAEQGLAVRKLNTDENQQIAAKYGIMSLPTIMLFKAGEPVKQIIGAYPKRKLEQELAPALSA